MFAITFRWVWLFICCNCGMQVYCTIVTIDSHIQNLWPLTMVTLLRYVRPRRPYILCASCLHAHYVWWEPGWRLRVTWMHCHSDLLSGLGTCVTANHLPVPVCMLSLWCSDVTWPLTFWGKCLWGLPSGGRMPAYIASHPADGALVSYQWWCYIILQIVQISIIVRVLYM